MEKRSNIVLRHKTTGLYFGRMGDRTNKLWLAWRFPDPQYLEVWLDTHSYAPDSPDDYEPVEIMMTIEIKEIVLNEDC
jgi:hypothetical protein